MTTIFSGTNAWREIFSLIKHLLLFRPLREGKAIQEYEAAFASYVGTKSAFSFASGRMALYVILEALGIGEGDEVIIPGFTCVVVPNAILYRRATPVYVDIENETFNLDVSKLTEKLSNRTKAVIAQHTFGVVCNIDAIRALGKERNIAVIEDCAHALGATHGGKKIGSLADVAFFSTDHTKVISTSTGGMVTTNDESLAQRIRSIQSSSRFLRVFDVLRICLTIVLEQIFYSPTISRLGRYFVSVFARIRLFMFFRDELMTTKPKAYPYPARLSNVQAVIGLHQLQNLENLILHRRGLARAYDSVLHLHANHLESQCNRNIFLYYSFLVKNRGMVKRFFFPEVRLNNWFSSIAHGRDADLKAIGYREGTCPVGEYVAEHIVNLPTHLRVRSLDKTIGKLYQLSLSGDLLERFQDS